jgi:hypothetical protein
MSTLTGKKARFGAVAAALVLLAGCHYVGKGTLGSVTGDGKAGFDFDLNCPTDGSPKRGTITYVDKPAGVGIRGTLSGSSVNCWSNDNPEGWFSGNYVSVTGPRGSGRFFVSVSRTSPRSTTPSGTFYISLTGGPFDGYTNSGPATGEIKSVGGSKA